MPKERTDPVADERGDEHHPAFGMISQHRVHSSPGEVLFQSDLRHPEYIRLDVHEATRKRDLSHDWVHSGRKVCEVSMSLAQFASFVASGGTEGVPCTIDYAGTGSYELGHRPGLNPSPRLAITTDEARAAADKAFSGIQEALAAYEALLASKAGAAERKAALATLRSRVANATSNVTYAAKKLTEHAESVVERSRADIDAMVARSAERLGIPQSELPALAELEEGEIVDEP